MHGPAMAGPVFLIVAFFGFVTIAQNEDLGGLATLKTKKFGEDPATPLNVRASLVVNWRLWA